jgi:hypothetical protein
MTLLRSMRSSLSNLSSHYKYLSYVLRHKWYVFLEAKKLDIPWLGFMHDMSKFRPDEWGPYVNFFYGKKAANPRDATGYYKPTNTGDIAFDYAWLLHQKRNRHHWQYWCLPNDDGTTVVLPMPERYLKEMLADWMGAGRAQGKPDCKAWYEANKHKIMLTVNERVWIELMLGAKE